MFVSVLSRLVEQHLEITRLLISLLVLNKKTLVQSTLLSLPLFINRGVRRYTNSASATLTTTFLQKHMDVYLAQPSLDCIAPRWELLIAYS